MSEFSGCDLALGSVHGVRQWGVDDLGRLSGVSHSNFVWRPGENVARCPRRRTAACKAGECGNDHINTGLTGYLTVAVSGITLTPSPGYCTEPGVCDTPATCVCGFWAYYDRARWNDDAVRGVIEGYGKTTLGTKGFRCEKAKIVALCLPDTSRGLRRWPDMVLVAAAVWAVGWAAYALGEWLSLVVQLAMFALNVGLLALVRRLRKRRPTEGVVPAETAALIRRNYPDVAIFSDYSKMLAAFPLSEPERPTPDDPEFWDRPSTSALPPRRLRANGGRIANRGDVP